MSGSADELAWLHGHPHEPNPIPPEGDATLVVSRPDRTEAAITLADLACLPDHTEMGCWIASTGHAVSGPYDFGGVRLADLIQTTLEEGTVWSRADVISADGFGTQVRREELERPADARMILLATRIDGQAMTRQQGLVRLIVPDDQDDALRQVKWVARIEVR